MVPARVMKIDALSAEERLYILGFFLADGSSWIESASGMRRGRRVEFHFSGNEEDLSCRIASYLRRAGLAPRVKRYSQKNMITLLVYSRSFAEFLPDKKALREDAEVREKLLVENKLFTVEFGIPFIAGLLDGDGSCETSVIRNRCYFGHVNQYKWSFSQSKYPFLVDYMMKFVGSLPSASKSVHVRAPPNRAMTVNIYRCGIKALMDAGISRHSWKVVAWLKKVAEIRSKRLKYYTTGQAAHVLKVSPWVVVSLLKVGRMKYIRGRRNSAGSRGLSYHYIPVAEVERFREELRREEATIERIKGEGMKLLDVAKMLRMSPTALYNLHEDGRLPATLVNEPRGRDHRYLVIPRGEIEKLEEKLKRR